VSSRGSADFYPRLGITLQGRYRPGLENSGRSCILFGGVDSARFVHGLASLQNWMGITHVLDGVSEQSTSLGWGSDIASLRSACGSGWQILATSPDADRTIPVRAFEMNDRAPVPATQAISIDGRVSALWPAADGSSAMAMSHNPEAGTYDAYRLTLTCSQ